jgi:radical SAM protein with 4Fe4S-binding SPASM domain
MFSPRQCLYDLYKSIETDTHELLYLFLEITRKCNLRCLHCGSDCAREEKGKTLTPESWFAIVDYVADHFSKDLIFNITGGEPLTSPFLLELGRKITERDRLWGIVTNGFGLDSRAFGNLLDAGIKNITISLDGRKEHHNYLRDNPLSHERAVEAVRLAAGSPLPFKDVVTCVYPGNLDDLDYMAGLLLELNMPSWRIFRIFPNGRARNNSQLLLSRAQSMLMINWIRDNRRKYAEKGLAINFSCEGWFPYGLDRKIRQEPFFCRAGVNIASILVDGTITGCTNNAPYFYEGSLLTDDLKTLWRDGFKKFRDRSWMKRGSCADCRDFRHCQCGSIHLWDSERMSPAFCYRG